MKRIIVEGMDNTGKTTLIQRLHSEFHNLVTIVNPKGPDQDFDRWWPAVMALEYKPFVPLHDRFFYSELVYGYHLRGFIKALPSTQLTVSARLREEALLIFCRPDNLAIKSTITNRPQMEGVMEQTNRLIQAYDELMWEEQVYYKQRFMQYEWNKDHELKRAVETVERYLSGELT